MLEQTSEAGAEGGLEEDEEAYSQGNGGLPQPKTAKAATPKVKPPKVLPVNAAAMHPCMLLTYMRANLEYRETTNMGDRPQTTTYTANVEVDGNNYVGHGTYLLHHARTLTLVYARVSKYIRVSPS